VSAPTKVDAALLRAQPLPRHHEGQDKNERGTVLVVGGSLEVPGAVLLTGMSALRAGAGKLRLATCRDVALHLAIAMPEALVMGLPQTAEGCIAAEAGALLLERKSHVHAVVIGPGMAEDAATTGLTAALLQGLKGPALLLDAGALTGVMPQRAALRRHAGRVVVTPHAGEMASLLDVPKEAVLADPVGMARQAAALLQAVVVMKGGCSFIVSPQGEAWSCDHGNVGLATSGSGDTLAGIIAGLLARGATPVQGCLWGVWMHGEAGNRLAASRGPVGFLAREIPPEIPAIMAGLAAEG
jgi:hydroxyethylthiazole kinase-like uncharacterized protein yjeF